MSSSRAPSPVIAAESKEDIIPAHGIPSGDLPPSAPPVVDVEFIDDFDAYTVLANGYEITELKITRDEHAALSIKDKKHFHAYLEHCKNVKTNLDNEHPNEADAKKELSLAASALKKLNSRPAAAACFAVLSVVAAAAAVTFLWPAAVVASLGITAMYLGIAAATVSISAATLSGLNANGVFQKSKYDDLKTAQEKLTEESRAAFRTP